MKSLAQLFFICVVACGLLGWLVRRDSPVRTTPALPADIAPIAEATPKPPAVPKPELQPLHIEVLKIYMMSTSHAAFDIRFTNTSEQYINHWHIAVEVYGTDDAYLGRGIAGVDMLKPGANKVDELILLDIHTSQINIWSATLTGVVGESGTRIDDQFKMTAD